MVKTLLLMVAAVAVAACKPQQPQQPQQPGQAEPCDSRVAERQRWFTTSHEQYDGWKPSDGLSVLGSCTDKLVDRQPSCDKDKLRGSVGSKPHLHDALALGFKTYVCELAGDQRRTEHPLADVLTKRVDERFTVKGAIAKMARFKGDMCRCKAGDKACSEKVERAMKEYVDSVKGSDLDRNSVTPDDEKEMVAIMGEFIKCQQTAVGTGDDRPIIEEAITKLKGFKDDMCKCKAGNKACAEKVERAMKDYMDSMLDRGLETARPTADDEKILTDTMAAMAKCQQAAMGSGAP